MIIQEKNIILKDGRSIVMKSPGPEDAQTMLHYIRQMSAETEFVGRYPEEITETLEEEEKFLQEARGSDSAVQISAFADGEIIGNASICPFSSRIKLRHRADFGIAVLQPYWSLGIGDALTAACLDAAEKMGYTQVELSMLASNEKGGHLYRKMGFREFGELKNGFRMKDGRYETEVHMVKYFA